MRYPCIEEQDYTDRTEFRILEEMTPPSEDEREASTYIRYAGKWLSNNNMGWHEDHCFIARKKVNWFSRWIGSTYKKQREHCIKQCNEIIAKLMRESEKPRTTIYRGW